LNQTQEMTNFKEIKKLFEITQENGFTEREILAYQHVCDNIPKVLFDYYLQLGKIQELNHTQDNLLAPNQLKLSEKEDYVIFYIENQWACVWGISKNDLNLDNPPIYMSTDEIDWELECSSLTDFLYAIANLQAAFALPFNAEEFYNVSLSSLEIIRRNFKKRDVALTKWIGIEFYGNFDNDVIAVMKNDGDYDLIYASKSEHQFKQMNDILYELAE